MKKTFVFLVLAAVSLAACTREELNPEEHHPVVKTVLTVGTAQTKTTLGDVEDGQRQLYWANNDEINVNGCTSGKLTGLAANTTSASFSFDDELTAPYKALYPASIYKDATTVTLPHNAGNQVIPLGGVSESTTFSLSPLTAMLHLKIKLAASTPDTDNITLIEVSTTDTRMSGEFTIDDNYTALTPAASPTGDDLKVQITGNWMLAAEATSFFIPVPAGEYSFTVKVMDSKGHYMTKSTTSAKEFTAGSIKPLKEFAFEPDQEGGLEIDSPEALIAFAKAYNRGDYAELGSNLVATVTANLTFDATSSVAFNATGGIGAGGSDDPLFNGVFDGGNHSINGLAATVPLFAKVGQEGTVKNLTMGATSSVTHSAAITEELHLGAIVGYNQGQLQDCKNYAPVSCTSTSFSAALYIGGLVGIQYKYGGIYGSTNYATVGCSASGPATFPDPDTNTTENTALVSSNPICMGGIVGCVARLEKGDDATVTSSRNEGAVNATYTVSVMSHIGGVIGWVNCARNKADKLTLTELSNVGDVTLANRKVKNDYVPALVAGLIGGIHAASGVSGGCAAVDIKNSSVSNCSVSNGGFSNATGYGEAIHTAGFVGVARGVSSELSFSENCDVKNVSITCRRGYAGGFGSYVRGATLNGCNVLASSVKGSIAQLRRGGGLVGYACDVTIKYCIVKLSEDTNYSLYGNGGGNDVILGGLVGEVANNITIDGCKVYVILMYAENYGTSLTHGWIIGKVTSGTSTITNCGLGGSYGNTSATTTLSNENFSNYICGYGSPIHNGMSYWDGSGASSGIRTTSINIAEYAAANSWTNGTEHSQIVKTPITFSASDNGEDTHNGIYYTDTPPDWRFYQARGGGLTITVPAGYSLVSATFTYKTKNTTDVLSCGSNQVTSGTEYSLSGTSATFTVGNTDNKTNGQARISNIVIKYE